MEPLPQPISPLLWLPRADLVKHISDVPVTFEVESHLDGYIKSIVQGWLAELIGEERVNAIETELIGSTGLSTTNLEWQRLITPFLANAVWSLYILHGNVIVTDTGPVTKLSEGFEPISNQQRTELSKFYKGEAERYALKLARKVISDQDACRTGIRSGRPVIRSAGGKRTSRFN